MSKSQFKVADEVWIATALLHREHPERMDFSVNEILQRAVEENLSGGYRQGLQMHASHHCVAQKAPNPPATRHRMLTETARGRRRLFRQGDAFHPARRDGKAAPDPADLPVRYRELLKWYEEEYSPNGSQGNTGRMRGVPGNVLLEFAGTIPPDDVARMEKVIEEECERVDSDES
ncbi:MAG: hypothetical protein WA188_10420 [Terriglobales bacterium]